MIDRTSYEPLYRQIRRDIEQQILDGRIAIGDKLMSETEMILHYGVGRVTVRNALSELVASGCLRKEQGAGTFCAALPRQEERKNIDVLLNTGDTWFMPYFLSGISRVFEGERYNLILHDTQNSMDSITRQLNEILERGTDGVILQPCTELREMPESFKVALEHCIRQKVPVVALDGRLEGKQIPYIINDDIAGGKLVTQHLIGLGHKRILGLFPKRYRDADLRAAGYREALEKSQLPVHLLDADITDGVRLVDYIRKEGITAMVCYNDYLAVKCYHTFHKQGIRPGQDICITGFDDTELSRTSLPRITTATHPKDRMGQLAAQYILDRLSGNADTGFTYVYQPDLKIRESTTGYTGTL